MRLAGKTAVITGGARGLGAEMAKLFAREGARVAAADMSELTPLEEQRRLADLMPNAELVILPRTGHAAFYERPELFASIMMGFMNLGVDAIKV